MKLSSQVQPYIEPTNNLSENKEVVKMVTPGITIFRVLKDETTNCPSPLIRINSPKTTPSPYFDTFIKEIAARLSDIEMALDCYDLSSLHFSTQVLKELFHDMKMPVLYRLAMHMEVLVKDNEMQGVKELFREIKKTIGAEVQQRQQG